MKGEIEKGVFFMNEYFHHAWREYAPSIWKACLFYTKDSYEAEDLMQTTWLKSFTYWQKKKQGSLTKAYFSTIARNTWIDECRKRKHTTIPYQDDEQPVDEQTDNIASISLVPILNQLASTLTINQQIVFLLADVCHCSLKEIAQLTNLSVGAVKANLFRARQKVKSHVRENIDMDPPIEEDQVLRVQLYITALQTEDTQLLASLLTDNATVRSLYAQQQTTTTPMECKMAA